MPISARRVAGIIRNVLPRRIVERPPPPVIVGSRQELVNRNKQIRKWDTKKAKLMKTQTGRERLALYFPRSYQQALLRRRKPGAVKRSRSAVVHIREDLKELSRHIHNRIMSRQSPKVPQRAPFPVGQKRVYLPNIVISLRRNPKLEPYFAVFDVPLNLSKLDLRDYLWHLYGVKSLSIRSSILPGRLKRRDKVPNQPRRVGPMRRTQARKKMIVQLAEPFYYPPELTTEQLEEYAIFMWLLILGSKRIVMNSIRNDRIVDSSREKWASPIILIPCTMYTINGVSAHIEWTILFPLAIFLLQERQCLGIAF